MANLAASAVSLYPTDGTATFYPNAVRPRAVIGKRLKLVLTGQGGQTNLITAASLGLSKIHTVTNLFDATNAKGYPAAVDPANNIVILFDGAAAPAPVDVTSSAAYITVTGSPLTPAI